MKSHIAVTISIWECCKGHWFSQKDDTKDSLHKKEIFWNWWRIISCFTFTLTDIIFLTKSCNSKALIRKNCSEEVRGGAMLYTTSGSFPMNQLLASGGQSIGASASHPLQFCLCLNFLKSYMFNQRNRVEREVGGGIGMGNTCNSMADSCQCMTKPTAMLLLCRLHICGRLSGGVRCVGQQGQLLCLTPRIQPLSPDGLHGMVQSRLLWTMVSSAVDFPGGSDGKASVYNAGDPDYGTIKKVRAPLTQTSGGCVLEEMELFAERRPEPVRSLRILHSQSVLFVGLREHVAKIPLKRCQFYRSRRNLTVDGHFGAWSPWTPCTHTDGSAVGSCLCRTRSCDSPAPQCGGWQCQGPRMEIVNCSRNGGWTPWTSWSPCSTTCGIGFQVRQRSCSNPTPRHGGRVCVGQNREERYCNEHLLCPPHVFWTGWGPWERCTAQCGGGIQARRRTCENGPDCAGCNVSWSEWSDWSECDVAGVQVRVRQCVLLFPVGSQCSGNTTESRPCVFDSNFIPEVSVARSSSIEEKRCGEFNLFHMIAVGLSSSILGCLLTLLVYTYCQRYQQQSHDATVIHPVAPAPLNTSITNHINKLDKYDSVEAIKAFNKNNLILEERNKYFNPHLTGKTYSNAYFTDLNNYDEPVLHDCPCLQVFRDGVWIHLKCISSH
ncbi:hypothetical protein FD755_018644 [Muntiacus reevesi]|uniref:Sema domain-containing protein n=1 Tax=Muntiacus reevesi TaxID=9886 RepID=A0A5N3X690_MUNRE|nr:hypothetical protein FD755_018644 [Muntiacus reevesi]